MWKTNRLEKKVDNYFCLDGHVKRSGALLGSIPARNSVVTHAEYDSRGDFGPPFLLHIPHRETCLPKPNYIACLIELVHFFDWPLVERDTCQPPFELDRADVAELRYGPLVVVEPSYLPASLFQVLERAG